MSLGLALGVVTAVLLGLFLGIVVWTFGVKRAADFDAMARLPLDDHKEAP
jgi:cbb3-type cytochrome oxidase subunit 3